MPVNKVNYGNQTIIDLTDSTLSDASQLVSGITAYDRSGTKITGTYEGSEWTSGIYMDEDGYIHVSPLAGAGGVYYDGGYVYFGEEQYSELPNGDDVGYGLNEPPHLISLNGHWEYDYNDTVDVTEDNHIIYVCNQNYGSGGYRIITRSDGKPWFILSPGKAEIIIKPDTGSLAANGRIGLYANANDVDPYWNFGPGYNSTSTGSTKVISDPILIYGIGIRRYWAGTTDIYIEIYCEGERIV